MVLIKNLPTTTINGLANYSGEVLYDTTRNRPLVNISTGFNKFVLSNLDDEITGIASLSATNLTGTLQTASQPNITSVGTLSSLTVSGALEFNSTTASTSTTTGALKLLGGIGIANSTDAVSADNGGSFTTAGGAAFKKSVYIGNNLHVGGDFIVTGTTTSVNTTQTTMEDNTLVINSGPEATGTDSGILTKRYQVDNDAGTGSILEDTASSTITLATDGTSNTFTVPLGNANNDYYKGWWVKVTSGASLNNVRQITAYDGTTKVATVSSNFTAPLATSDTVDLFNNSFSTLLWKEDEKRFIAMFSSVDKNPALSIQNYADMEVKNFIINSTTASTSSTTGALKLAGGIGISNTTDASSATNGGSFTTAGGLSVAKTAYVGANLNVANNFVLGGSTMTSTQVDYLTSITPGTASASKALVLDSSSDVTGINELTVTTLNATNLSFTSAELTSLNTTGNVGINTSSTTSAALEINEPVGTDTALRLTYRDSDGGATTYTDFSVNSSGNLNVTPSGGIVDITTANGSTSGLSLGGTLVTATATELNYNDVTPGTATASKTLVLDSNLDITGIHKAGMSSIELTGNLSGALSTSGVQYRSLATVFTDNATAESGTNTTAVVTSFAQPTLAATNATVTTTNASTVYIADAPAAGTNMTLTNAYALWVASGKVKFGDTTASTSSTTGALLLAGGIGVSNTTNASNSTNGGSFTTAGGAAIALDTYIGGTLDITTGVKVGGTTIVDSSRNATFTTVTTGTEVFATNNTKAATTAFVQTEFNTRANVTFIPTGFENKTDSVITYDPATRIVSIAPTATAFYVWVKGIRYEFTTAQTLPAHANTPGVYFYYFNGSGVFTSSPTFPGGYDDAMTTVVYYYDATHGFHTEERHNTVMDPATHAELHNNIGTYYVSGLALSGYNLLPAIPADTDNTFAIASGVISDEELRSTITAVPDNGPYTVYYLTGSSSNWTWTSDNTVPYSFTPDSYISYNQWNGSTWQLTDVNTSGRWVNYYVLFVPSLSTATQVLMVPGQEVYTTLTDAQAENFYNLNLTSLSIPEFLPLYKITYETNSGFTSSGKCRMSTIERIVGTRVSIKNNVASNHQSLTDVQMAANGITNGHINDQTQTIAGSKTFSSNTIISSTTNSTSSSTGALTVSGGFGVTADTFLGGNLSVEGPILKLPTGNTSARPASPAAGYVRYNSETSQFEGYGPGNAWGSLGGVMDVNQDTKILAENAPGDNDDNLRFLNNGTETMRLTKTNLMGVGTTAPDKKVEINSATGDCLRLTYDDSNGSATNYVDLLVTSGGDLTLTPSGGDFNISTHNGSTTGLQLNGTLVTATATELNYNDVTPGTATASKTLVLDSNLDVTGIHKMGMSSIELTGALSGTLSTSGVQYRSLSTIFTDNATAESGTNASAVVTSFAQPTLAATNATVTTTNASTVYIADAPAAGTNMTLTNAYALWVAAGKVNFGDTTDSSSPTTGALTVAGGVGVNKSMFVKDSVNTKVFNATFEDSAANTVTHPIVITRNTTNTPAAGLGAGLGFYIENSTNNNQFYGSIEVSATNVTEDAEEGKLQINLVTAGAESNALTLTKESLSVQELIETSDVRVKENFQQANLEESYNRIMQLNMVDYNFINDETKRKHRGVIAQEVKEIIPEAVVIIEKDNLSDYHTVSSREMLNNTICALQFMNQKYKDLEEKYQNLLEKLDNLM